MPWVGFEPMIAAGEQQYTYALDRAATGTGVHFECYKHLFSSLCLMKCFTRL